MRYTIDNRALTATYLDTAIEYDLLGEYWQRLSRNLKFAHNQGDVVLEEWFDMLYDEVPADFLEIGSRLAVIRSAGAGEGGWLLGHPRDEEVRRVSERFDTLYDL